MTIRNERLSRRYLLRGIGGASLGLPFLELMTPRKAQAASPLRYVVCFGGSSLGNNHADLIVPKTTGDKWELTTGFKPLGGQAADPGLRWASLQKDVSIVSGLKIPWGAGDAMPLGGRPLKFHSSTPSPLFAGVRAVDANVGGYSSSQVMGTTSDQLVADKIGAGRPFRSLEYRIQAQQYREPEPNKGRMSWRRDAAGVVNPNNPIASPRVAYDQLFRGFAGTTTPVGLAPSAATLALEQERSVLDLVRGNADSLMTRLGPGDKLRLQRHFDEIRDLERRIDAIGEPVMVTSSCKKLPDPGSDPATEIRTADPNIGEGDFRANGWSNEEKRATVMCDLLHMALACDQTRVATLMFTYVQSFMSMKYIFDKDVDLHDTGHHFGPPEPWMALGIAWHMKHWAYLLDKMRATQESDGTLLDNSVVLFITEGGFGLDPEVGRRFSAHSTENMMVLVAGRAGGLRPGRHIIAKDRHPAAVVGAAMTAVGVPGGLGEIKDVMTDL
jgi:Protein of unknown function (DUF1552)